MTSPLSSATSGYDLALKTFDIHDIQSTLATTLLCDAGGCMAVILCDASSREYLRISLIRMAQKHAVTIVHIHSEEALIQELNAPSLFAEKTLYVLNNVTVNADVLPEPPPGSCIAAFVEKKSQLPKERSSWMCLEFPPEKPWDTTARLSAWAETLFTRRKKRVDKDLLHALVVAADGDFLHIHSECEKIILYAVDSSTITRADASQISNLTHEEKEWALAEDIVWKCASHRMVTEDQTRFFRFLGLVRYHLQLGLSLSTTRDIDALLKERYPKLRKKADKLYVPRVKSLGAEYFIQGNVALSTLEQHLRTSPHLMRHLWDMFISNMRCHI